METITLENFEKLYADPIELQQIDKFVCDEVSRQMHRYIKAMKGSHSHMTRFEQRLRELPLPQREQALARYIDLNRHSIDGLDWKLVVARAMADYCDTYSYFTEMLADERRMSFYVKRVKEKYKQFHKIIESADGHYGIATHDGRVLVPAIYDFLRTPYVYVDDLTTMPVIAQRNGRFGLVSPDGEGTVIVPFLYDDIQLHDEPPYFEAWRDGESTTLM